MPHAAGGGGGGGAERVCVNIMCHLRLLLLLLWHH